MPDLRDRDRPHPAFVSEDDGVCSICGLDADAPIHAKVGSSRWV